METSMDFRKRRFHLEVTGACNLRCQYCYNSHYSGQTQIRQELSLEEHLQLIDQAVALGCRTFIFSGGEPFLNRHIMELIGRCPPSSRASVITNGSRLTAEVIDQLEAAESFKEIKISWDGFEAHDRVRIGSSHEQVEEAIRQVKERAPSVNVIVNTMVNRHSVRELLAMYPALKRLGIGHWRIDMPFNTGRCAENPEELMGISFAEIILTYRDLLEMYFRDGKPMILEIFNVYKSQMATEPYYDFDDNVHPCAYYNNTVTVRPDGTLTFCPSLAFKVSDWRENGQDLAKAVQVASEHPYGNVTLHQIEACRNCRYLKLCGGGCRADAITWGSGTTGSDPISCSIMPLLEEHIIPILPAAEREACLRLIDANRDWPKRKATALEILDDL